MVSLIGSWMQSTAQSYLVLELTHQSATALRNVTIVQFLPSLLLSAFAGAIIDRVPRRRVLLATQLTMLACSSLLAFATHQGFVSLYLVMAVAFVAGMANAFDMPARQSMVVDFVPREAVTNAVALNSLSFNVSRTIGQALFGPIAAMGIGMLAHGNTESLSRLALPFYLNIFSFFLVIFVIATLPFPPRDGGLPQSVTDDIKQGARYVLGNRNVLSVMVLLGALSLTVLNFNVVIPYFSRAVFDVTEKEFGFLSAFFGLGAMAGALWQASKPNPVRNLRIGAVLMCIGAALLAWSPSTLLARPVLALCGFSMLTMLISANSTVQLSIPDELRGRVMSLYSLVVVGFAPFGAAVATFLIDKKGLFGPRWGLTLLAVLGVLAVALLWVRLPRTLAKAKASG